MAQTPEERYAIVRDAIMAGKLDSFLDELMMAVQNRRQVANRQRAYELEPGDFITLPANTKPRMLSNQVVIFEGMDHSKLRVRLTATYSPKWRSGNIIRIPPTMVAKVVKHRDARQGASSAS